MLELYKPLSNNAKLLLGEYNARENHRLKDILLFYSKFQQESPSVLEG